MRIATVLLPLVQSGGAFQSAPPYAAFGPTPTCTTPSSLSAASPAPSSFLGGTDDCSLPHVFIGMGPVEGVSFVTGTTGTQGQNSDWCWYFGTPAITDDVWFDWTANATGVAQLTTCNGTSVDTKIAVWSNLSPSQCPSTTSALACSEDGCGQQTTVTWSVSFGVTYTIQLGTSPGSPGGSGNFDIAVGNTPPCGQYDIQNGRTALGLNVGGETGWLHYYDCMQTVHTVSTQYGDPNAGASPDGAHSWILVYEDASCDVDPTTDLALRAAVETVVTNGDTGLFNTHPIGPVSVAECFWVAATADNAPGEFPAPMAYPATPAAWVVGSTLGPGTLDIHDLNANNVPPLQMIQIGFPVSWFLRAEGLTGPGTAYCFGDGSGTPCPCGNASASGAGCGNGSFPEGAMLLGSGTSLPDTVTLVVSGATPSQPGLFFQGDQDLNGGAGFAFGDGLRCAGRNVVRLQVAFADSGGFATSTVALSTTGGAQPGDTRFYQYWYRDPVLSPCGSGFNLTNGYEIAW